MEITALAIQTPRSNPKLLKQTKLWMKSEILNILKPLFVFFNSYETNLSDKTFEDITPGVFLYA